MSRKVSLIPFIFLLIGTSSWANGFYIGAGLGPDTVDFNQDAHVIVNPPGSTMIASNVKDTTHLSGTGVFGTIFGGYGWRNQNLYLAGEINADLSSVEFSSSNQEFVHSSFAHVNYKIQHSYGFSILPGYLYTDATLFYVRLGYVNGDFKISSNDPTLANINKNLGGFRYGLGINQAVAQHIKVRMEYSHITYQNTQFTVIDPPATKRTQISPQTNQVEFSVMYDFA